jgi:guanylate kinase
VIVNDELNACVERLRSIVLAERSRLRAMRGKAEQIVESFLERTDSGS